ncbi:MAG: DUF4878 domain-containing protein [Aureispira sp.]|nr:DUF4878 domain-containing protein [Aureispira sp.]
MKKSYYTFLIALFASCIFASCSSPKTAVVGFMNKMQDMDFAGAKKYSSEETKKLLGSLESMMAMMPKEEMPPIEDKKIITKDWVKCKTQGKEGTCQLCEGDDCTDDPIKVIKEQGQWKVHLAKEDMNKEEPIK